MSTPRALVRASVSLELFLNCACRLPPPPSRCNRYEHPLKQHARCFASSPTVLSGHSKWASIKHDKGKIDAARAKARALLTKDISNAVKLAGPDPNMNPRLALAISSAKKNAVPKASIEAALARGQGLSASGAALESVVLEAILPPSIATVIECQTDNKLRLLSDLRLLVKEAGGSVSPIGYMFEKKGRIILQKKEGLGADEALEPALEAGAIDVDDDEDGRVVLYTDPAQTKTAAETLSKQLEVQIEESEIIWDPNEDTMVAVDDENAAKDLGRFLDQLQELSGIQGVYLNWSKGAISDELWAELRSKADA